MLEKRIQSLKAKLEELKPQKPPTLLVIQFCSEVNPNAPEGTIAAVDQDDRRPNRFAMVPKGFTGELPKDLLTFEEWSQKGNGHA